MDLVRPHPLFWWIVILGINLVHELALVLLLFQDLHTARLELGGLHVQQMRAIFGVPQWNKLLLEGIPEAKFNQRGD